MKETSRIPLTIPEFNIYINRTDDYLLAGIPITNRERLTLTVDNGDDWSAKRKYWHDTLYKKYSDPTQRTNPIEKEVAQFMKDFRVFANPLIDIIAACPAVTADDAAVFNFVLVRAQPTHRTTPIEEMCYSTVKMIGGANAKFGCRSNHDTKRPSLAENADAVQVAYKVGDPKPANVNDGTTKEVITKASFVLPLDEANRGKNLYSWTRWYDTRHPNLAGPWGSMQTDLIS